MLKFLFKNKIKNAKVIVGGKENEYYVYIEDVEEFQKLGMAQTHMFYKKNMTNTERTIELDEKGLVIVSSVIDEVPETIAHGSRASEINQGNLARLLKYVSVGACSNYNKDLVDKMLSELGSRGSEPMDEIDNSNATLIGKYHINSKSKLKVKDIKPFIIDTTYKYKLGDIIKVKINLYCMTPTGLVKIKDTTHLL